MRTLTARAVAALALLALCASQAAALKWRLIGTLPDNASLMYEDSISLWPASGTGLVGLVQPKAAQYYTSNNGATWSLLSNWYIQSVYMAGGQAAFGVGQLAQARNSSKPLDLLRWQKGKGWSVSLKPPAASGVIGISVSDIVVTDAGQTAFALGTLVYNYGNGYTSVAPDGKYTQHVWRFKAATNSWTSIHKGTYTKITANGVATKGKFATTPRFGSLAASSGSLLWASWAGRDAAGVTLTGRVSLWNGASWKVVRQGAANEAAAVTGVAPDRAWIVVNNSTAATEDVWLFTGAQGARKLAAKGFDTRISAPSTQVAVVAQRVSTAADSDVLRMWRWDEAAKSFKGLKDVADVPVGWQVAAASAKWTVLAGVQQGAPANCLAAQVWNGHTWTAVTPLNMAGDVSLTALVALPGSALVALPGKGVWRLVA